MSGNASKRQKVETSATVTLSGPPLLHSKPRQITGFTLPDESLKLVTVPDVTTGHNSCYQDLKDPSRDIRLLYILPNPHPQDRRLQCRLIASDMHLPYAALSYTWGEEDGRNLNIWVNGIQVRVRRNLMCALRTLQANFDLAPALWVDALCINQNDVDERNSQVALMGRIYENAAWVIVWLGTPQEFNFRRRFIPAFDLLRFASGFNEIDLVDCPIPLEPDSKSNWLSQPGGE
jgi:hypothetical protein